jgi:class 3 adenylate cyclase
MNFLERLEQQMALPGDTPTLRRQRAITFVPAASSVVFELLWGIAYFAVGGTVLGYIYLIAAVLSAVASGLAVFGRSLSRYAAGVALTSVVVIAANFALHAVSGGFGSGMWFLAWIVIIPLSSFFTGMRGIGWATLVAALAAYLVAVFLDARFAAWPGVFETPSLMRLVFNLFVLINTTTLVFIWGVYLMDQLDRARAEADALLLNILPASIAERLKHDTAIIADGVPEATVLFADIVDFTRMSSGADPIDVVRMLNDLFTEFDALAAKHGLEKIKTIGDAYMVAGGLPEPRLDHCEAVAAFAVDLVRCVEKRVGLNGEPLRVRVGVNCGPVVAGVIGRQKFIYDLWGDAVNTASRMESNGLANAIQVTGAVKDRLGDRYVFEERPPIAIKGKGEMVTYVLTTGPAGG